MSEILRIIIAIAATIIVVVSLLYAAGAINLHQPVKDNQSAIPAAVNSGEGTSNGTSNETGAIYNFIQEGSNGTFVPDSTGNYTLTMTTVTPYTFYISDRPVKDAGFVPMKRFLDTFSWGIENPPNAAIIIPGAKEDEDTLLVSLTNPVYVPEKELLTYNATILKSYKSKGLKQLVPFNDPMIQKSFGRVTLIIDSCPNFKFYCYSCNQDPAMACKYFMGGSGWVKEGTCWDGWKGCQPCHPQQIIEDCNNQCPDCQQTCDGTSTCMYCFPGFPV